MATDHNFRIKNGLEVGGQLIVTSSGQLAVAAVSSQLQFLDNVKAKFGNGSDLQIYHTGTESWIKDAGTGNLYIDSNGAAIQLTSGNAAKSMINAVPDGGVTLFHNNNIKLNTSSDGATVTGNLAVTNTGNNTDIILTEGGTNTDARIRNSNGILQFDADLNNEYGNSSIVFKVDGSTKAEIDRNGRLYLTGQTNNYIKHDTNYLTNQTSHGYIQIGPGNAAHAHLLTDRSNFYFNKQLTVDTGIVTSYDEDLILRRASNSADGQLRLSRGLFRGESQSATDLLNSSLILGGFTTNSAFEEAFNHFYIPGLSPNQLAGSHRRHTVTITKNGTTYTPSSSSAMFSANGANTSFSHAAGSTDTIVITITGISMSYGQHVGVQFGHPTFRAKDIEIEVTTDNGANWTSVYDVTNFPYATVAHYHGGSGTATNGVRYTFTNFNNTGMRINQLFCYDYSENEIYFAERNQDQTIRGHWTFTDNYELRFGSSADLKIKHDGGHSYIQDVGTGSLYLDSSGLIARNASNNNNMIVANAGGSVTLYHNGSDKFSTQSWGALVNGTLNTDKLHIGAGSTDLIDVHHDGTFISTYRNNTGGITERKYADYGNDGTTVEFQNRIGADGNYSSIGNFSAHGLQIRTNNTNRLNISSSGTVEVQGTAHFIAPTIRVTNDATDTTRHRVAVYDSGSTSYGMMLWNSNGTSGDWATMIYGPNQSNRRISFGKITNNTFSNHSHVTEAAHFDLDTNDLILNNGTLFATGTSDGVVARKGAFGPSVTSFHASYDLYNNGTTYLNGTVTTGGILNVTGALSAATLNTGQGANELYAMNQNVRTTDSPTFDELTVTDFVRATGNNLKFSAGGTHILNIDVNGKIYPNTHNAYDIGFSSSTAFRHAYFSGTGNFANINTGQGATEVHLMNQNVRTSDSPTFASLTLTGDLNITGDINTTTVNDLDVQDKTITVAAGAASSSAADDAGLIIGGAGSKILWDHAEDKFQFSHGINFDRDTYSETNQNLGIYWSAWDKESGGDQSDTAFIRHTENTGGHSNSVLEIKSGNDSGDGIAFTTHSGSTLKHNSSNILTAANFTSNITNLLTTSTTFAGDVDGTYNNLVIDVPTQTSAPTASTGRLWWDSNTGNLKIYNGSAWVTASAIPDVSGKYDKTGGAITGAVSMSSTLAVTGNITGSANIQGNSIIKTGGTSSQFLKADGSVDSSTYLTGNQTITLTGDVTGSGTTSITTTVANDSHNHSSSSGNFSVGGTLFVPQKIEHTSDSNTYMEFDSGDQWRVVTGGVERIRIIGGDVGIGDVDPTDGDLTLNSPKLHVKGPGTASRYNLVARFEGGNDSDNTGGAILVNHGNDRGLMIEGGRSASDRAVAYFGLLNSSASHTRIFGLYQDGGTYTAGINIDPGTYPHTELQVGNPETASTGITIAARYDQSAAKLTFRTGHPNNANVWNTSQIASTDDGNYNGRLEFRTSVSGQAAPTTRMFIRANGNVGIGSGVFTPNSLLDVDGRITANNLTLQNLSAQNSEATSLMIDGSGIVGTRELGSNAFNSTAYLPLSGGTMTGAVTTVGQTWNGDITWNTGKNILVAGESSIDVSGSGYFQVYDSGAGASFILCDVGSRTVIGTAGSRGLLVVGEMESSSLDVNGNGDISGALNVGGSTTIGGNLLVADQIRIGDDAWLEDYNVANSVRVKGNQNNNIGFIAFGQQTASLGCNGTSTLSYNGLNLVDVNGDLYSAGRKFMALRSNSSNTERGPWNPIITSIRNSGRRLYPDEDFRDGSNSIAVYNNSGGGTVTHTREDATTNSGGSAPNSSGKVIRINHNGGTSSPGFGGFIHTIPSEDNHTFVQIFQAKLPTGKNFVIAENAQGTNNQSYWLTDTAGTGKWEWYGRVSHCGNSGSFSSGGHVYVTGGSGNFNWYLASSTVIDVTEPNLGETSFFGNIILEGDPTTSNQDRMIDFTGYDKEGTTDFSDRAFIRHTTNQMGLTGSVLLISSQNDANDGIAFHTNASSLLKHNSNSIFTDGYHPNADKWTTARSHTVTLTGEVTGTATQSVDGTGNKTWSIATTLSNTALDDQYVDVTGDTMTGQLVLNNNIASPGNYYNALQMEIRATSGTAGIGLHRNGNSHCGIYHDSSNALKFNFNGGTTTLNHDAGTLLGTGNYTSTLDGRYLRMGGTYALGSAIRFQSNDVIDNASGTQAALEVFQDNAGEDAFMAFHISGDYAAYFGLDGVSNDFVFGGWSKGAVKQRIFHDGYHPNADTWTTARTATVTLTGDATGTAGVSVNGSGNWTNSIAVTVGSIDGQQFYNTRSNSGLNSTGLSGNGIFYYTSGPGNFSGNATDGAAYYQSYSSIWQHTILGDYRSGALAVKSKNNGTWQETKRIPMIFTGSTTPTITTHANNSEFWYDTSDGTLKFYYNDGNSSQWVDAVAVPSVSNLYSKGGGAISGAVTINSTLTVDGNAYLEGDYVYGHDNNGTGTLLQRFGGLYFTWDADQYGTNFEHSITSTSNGTWGDNITLNSFGDVRINIDSNSNSTSTFSIGHHTTGTANTLFTVADTGKVTLSNPDLRQSTTGSTPVWIGHNQYTNSSSSAIELRRQTFTGVPGEIAFYTSASATTTQYMNFRMNYQTFHAEADIVAYSSQTTSDIRLKKNVRDLEGSLDKTLKLRGVKFDWKDEEKGKDELGFIAQEIEEVVPEVVKEVEAIGKNEGEKHKVVNYPALVPMLVEAIKEQQTIINKLEQRLNDLEKREE